MVCSKYLQINLNERFFIAVNVRNENRPIDFSQVLIKGELRDILGNVITNISPNIQGDLATYAIDDTLIDAIKNYYINKNLSRRVTVLKTFIIRPSISSNTQQIDHELDTYLEFVQ